MTIICAITPNLFPELAAKECSTVNSKRLEKTQKVTDPILKQVSTWVTHLSPWRKNIGLAQDQLTFGCLQTQKRSSTQLTGTSPTMAMQSSPLPHYLSFLVYSNFFLHHHFQMSMDCHRFFGLRYDPRLGLLTCLTQVHISVWGFETLQMWTNLSISPVATFFSK